MKTAPFDAHGVAAIHGVRTPPERRQGANGCRGGARAQQGLEWGSSGLTGPPPVPTLPVKNATDTRRRYRNGKKRHERATRSRPRPIPLTSGNQWFTAPLGSRYPAGQSLPIAGLRDIPEPGAADRAGESLHLGGGRRIQPGEVGAHHGDERIVSG